MATFDIAKARSHFPALNQPQIFFDNAGGSQTLKSVIDSIVSYLSNTNVQLGATYNVGKKTTALYEEGYSAAAKFINADVDNIVLGSSTSQLFRNLSHSLFPSLSAGSEIIISSIDHEANIAPWVDMAERLSLKIIWWTPKSSSNPKLTVEDLRGLLTEKTVMVTCTHASNILGTITDVKAISKLVHETVPGAFVCVDGVAYAPHRQIDVQDLGVDLYCFSWYKVYGPHLSMLYASPRALSTLQSQGHFFNPHTTLTNKLGLAGASYELVASIPSVLSYLPPGSFAAIASHEEVLQKSLLTYLTSKENITIQGETSFDPAVRVSTISFTVKGRSSKEVVEAVEGATNGEIGIRWGGFYSERLRKDVLGLESDGVVRVSMVHYNSVEEVKKLIEVFEKVLNA